MILLNISQKKYIITPGMRIAQMIISPITLINPVEADDLGETERATGGFGSTGL